MNIIEKNVIYEYSKLIKSLNDLKNKIPANKKIYKILDEFFIHHLIENFKVLQFLLKNNKIYGCYEIIRGNFELTILILFILEDKELIEKKIGVYEYLRFVKFKKKLRETMVDSIMEFLEESFEGCISYELSEQLKISFRKVEKKLTKKLFMNSIKELSKGNNSGMPLVENFIKELGKNLEKKEIKYPYNLEQIENNFKELKRFVPNNINIYENVKKYFKGIEQQEKNIKLYEKKFKEEVVLIKNINKKYPVFYSYFGEKKLKINDDENKSRIETIERIEVKNKKIYSIDIKNGLEKKNIIYDKNTKILLETNSIKKLCKLIGKEKYYETVYEITSSIIHGEISEFRNDIDLLKNTTFTNNILTCEIIKKLSSYYLDENSRNEMEKNLKNILGKNYIRI